NRILLGQEVFRQGEAFKNQVNAGVIGVDPYTRNPAYKFNARQSALWLIPGERETYIDETAAYFNLARQSGLSSSAFQEQFGRFEPGVYSNALTPERAGEMQEMINAIRQNTQALENNTRSSGRPSRESFNIKSSSASGSAEFVGPAAPEVVGE
ncbi:unnamed protein product, partial [marine sediment metagenome]